MRVLLIGGTGVFGSRLAMGLRKQADLDVRIAGRGGANDVQLDCVALDVAARIAAEAPAIVIDAAGPFQLYDDDPYRVARAAVAVGAHYLDLSDDATFTTGITALDAEARQAGVAVLSGVSTVPAISSVVADALVEGMDDVHLIESVLIPGNRAPRGLSVMRAILAQAGQRLSVRRAGHPRRVHGWGELRRIDMPGLGRRWVSTIGAPDTTLFPDRYGARSVAFGAGLELWFMHLGLWAMSLPVRWGLVRSLEPVARPMRWVAGLFERLGTDRGGMLIRVVGQGPSDPVLREWSVIAEDGDGPHIPALPARVMVTKLMAGKVPPGARPALAGFSLSELEAISSDLAISFKRTETPLTPAFRQTLGTEFDCLPAPVRDLHTVLAHRRWSGMARVDRGAGLAVRIICAVVGFPPARGETPLTVTMERRGETEVWLRDFGGKRFRSHVRAAGLPGDGVVTERFGPLIFRIGLKVVDGTLTYPVLSGRCGPIPIPQGLLPRSETVEASDGTAATFDVKVSLPRLGLLVRYRGHLNPDEG